MKNFMMILAIVLFYQAEAQSIKEKDVPAVVKAVQNKAYPSAKDVKWNKEKESFEAGFTHDKKEMSVVYDAQGNELETETAIEKSTLPKPVLSTLSKDFASYKVTEAATINTKGVITYEAEVKKGKEILDLVFDSTGKLLKKTAVKEEKENEKN